MPAFHGDGAEFNFCYGFRFMQTKEDFLKAYHQMVSIRLLEEACAYQYAQKQSIHGFMHLYIGQEAVAVGMSAAMSKRDHVIMAYRDHGVALTQGMQPGVILAELMGKATGCSKGKGGSMHLADPSLNFWGGHAIVGAQLPLAAGMALGFQHQKQDNVVVGMMGDGSTNIGYFHESLNLSKVWNLPVVWLVENNFYGMWTPLKDVSAVTQLTRKADAYDIPHQVVDGMNVESVYQAVAQALEHARTQGPYFLEVMTYRFVGHSMGDNRTYKDAKLDADFKQRDPIGLFRTRLQTLGYATEAELDERDDQIEAEIAEAVRFAEDSPYPDASELYTDVYTTPVPL